MSDRSWEVIVEVGAEGGGITLYGKRVDGAWSFAREIIDQTPQLLDEAEIRGSSNVVTGWVEALALLDKYSWAGLYPISVHPEFAARVLAATSDRLKDGYAPEFIRDRWEELCHRTLNVQTKHRLAPLIAEASKEPAFADRWGDETDRSFRPYAVAVLQLRNASRLSKAHREGLYLSLCEAKRIEVLGEIHGSEIAPRVLKLLSRTDWPNFGRPDWGQFLAIACAEDDHSPLGHLSSITSTLVRQFASIPIEVRIPAILNVACDLDIPAERWTRLNQFLQEASQPQRASLLRSAANVTTTGEFWDFYFRCEGKHSRSFDIPRGFYASALLRPIASPLEMELEASRMENCLAKRVSRVQGASRIYFRVAGEAQVNAEIMQADGRWIPGDILGPKNTAVAEPLASQIRTELQRLASSTAVEEESTDCQKEKARIDKLQKTGRTTFAASEVELLADALRSILGKSISWTDGAYAIFELKCEGYVQFMSSPDGTEFLCEINSHKYGPGVNKFLTADAVDLIETAGFVWPTSKSNFLRWFTISTDEDIRRTAEIALAILSGVFRHRKGQKVLVKMHIPG